MKPPWHLDLDHTVSLKKFWPKSLRFSMIRALPRSKCGTLFQLIYRQRPTRPFLPAANDCRPRNRQQAKNPQRRLGGFALLNWVNTLIDEVTSLAPAHGLSQGQHLDTHPIQRDAV